MTLINGLEEKKYKREYYLKNKDKYKAARKRRQELYGDEIKKKQREWYRANRAKARLATKRNRYKKEYNLSLDDLDKLLKSQNNCCLICSIDFSKTRYNVDHNHITGKVRGALCNSCNRGIGFLKDNFELLVNAAKYIQEKDNISV